MSTVHAYSLLECAVHRMIFGSSVLQDLMEDIERVYFAEAWKDKAIDRPVFITSLPRAGTTILLESLSSLPGTATHHYSDMPFIYAPYLWRRLSSRMRQKEVKEERAHGDGIRIGFNSPEAFEEVFWKKYFPGHYGVDGIKLWDGSVAGFEAYFREQIKKLLALRSGSEEWEQRYLSKNNANIARINVLRQLFPDAFVVVPLRNPIEHAISMWRQHHNFLRQHAESRFARRYMEDIGHYEFGALHRPIRFPLLESVTKGLKPEELDYWVGYWIAAFDMLSRQHGISIVRYETLSSSGTNGLSRLARHLRLDAPDKMIAAAAAMLHPPPPPRQGEHPVESYLAEQAMSLYEKLARRCLLA